MTENTRSRIADLKTLSILVGVVVAMSSVAWTVVSWANSLMPRVEAKQQHQVMWKRIGEVDDKADKAIGIKRDVGVIKCILSAPNRKAKQTCGLQEDKEN